MRPAGFLILLIPIILIIGCNSNPTDSLLSRNFPLNYGQSLAISNYDVSITFDSLLVESRCPIDPLILCITPGLATIKLQVVKAGTDTEFVNVSIPGFTDTTSTNHYPWATAFGLKIRLRQLDPYPDSTGSGEPTDYKAWLEVQDYYSMDGDAVIITDESPLGLMVDPYEVDNISVNSQFQANISVSYAGGCNEHDLYLFMSPSDFEIDTPPPKANLYLQHLGYGDACDAMITKDLTFDLTPLVNLLQIETDGEGSSVLLTIFQYDGIDLLAADTVTVTVAPGPLD